jgi:hypothetical protein
MTNGKAQAAIRQTVERREPKLAWPERKSLISGLNRATITKVLYLGHRIVGRTSSGAYFSIGL